MLSPSAPKKLFLLDAFALIYRAYFAFAKNPRVNSKGQNTSAAFGFTNVLIDVIKNEKPTHLAVVFDPPGGSAHRQEQFEAYKAQREEMPEDIRSMIQPIKRIVEAFNVPILEVPGFEADDVVGTIAKIADQRGFITYMMTPDKDYCQLVTETAFIYKPGRGGNPPEILGVKEVCAKFEVQNPSQVIDILGLWGDASDNIPGIPGIGEKTSKLLIAQYGSIENLIANAHELKGKQQENVINFADQGLTSKMLATIITDVKIDFEEEKLIMCDVDKDKIREIFTELEFLNLSRRILGEEITLTQAPSPLAPNKTQNPNSSQLDLFGTQSMVESHEPVITAAYKTIVTERPSYHLISTAEERKELLEILLAQKQVCFDTETTNIDASQADLVGISFSYKAREAFYVAIPKEYDAAKSIIHEFMLFFQNTGIEKIAHNIKYDLKVLSRYGISLAAPTFDTMIAHYLINPEARQNMDFLAQHYLNYQAISIETLIGKKGKSQGNMRDLEPSEISDYACEDADITLQLKHIFEKEIKKPHLKDLFYDMEMPLVEVLMQMEEEGIAIDSKALAEYSKELDSTLIDLDSQIKELAGMEFNTDSPKQMGEVLFEKLKISAKAKKTKTGQYATSEDVLEKHKHDHPIVPLILEYRQLRKLKNTYVDALPTYCDQNDGRIHTNFMQTVTATGRLSSNNPNLQNIPIRSEKGREIRRAFVSRDKDHKLMAVDYSQIELRIIAALSEDPNMIQSFRDGLDIHAATAAKVYGVSIEEVTREQRSAAKAVNFGIIYGQSAFGLAQNLKISRTEAKEIIDSYFEQYGTIKNYMDKVISQAREEGYVETIMKRRRYLPDINSGNAIVRGYAERNAINAPIQGSAADIIKMAMISVHSEMKKENVKSKMILQVHDELVFDVHNSEEVLIQDLVRKAMEKAVKLSVPMQVELKLADNWLDAH
ncbi:MAG: DNA polymerase I [Flavobacteriales bacterium]|nr:DNA polymerase I [Flavobacteriales bacterium]